MVSRARFVLRNGFNERGLVSKMAGLEQGKDSEENMSLKEFKESMHQLFATLDAKIDGITARLDATKIGDGKRSSAHIGSHKHQKGSSYEMDTGRKTIDDLDRTVDFLKKKFFQDLEAFGKAMANSKKVAECTSIFECSPAKAQSGQELAIEKPQLLSPALVYKCKPNLSAENWRRTKIGNAQKRRSHGVAGSKQTGQIWHRKDRMGEACGQNCARKKRQKCLPRNSGDWGPDGLPCTAKRDWPSADLSNDMFIGSFFSHRGRPPEANIEKPAFICLTPFHRRSAYRIVRRNHMGRQRQRRKKSDKVRFRLLAMIGIRQLRQKCRVSISVNWALVEHPRADHHESRFPNFSEWLIIKMGFFHWGRPPEHCRQEYRQAQYQGRISPNFKREFPPRSSTFLHRKRVSFVPMKEEISLGESST